MQSEAATLSTTVHELRVENTHLREALSMDPRGSERQEQPGVQPKLMLRQKEEILKLNSQLDDERRVREEDVRSIQSDLETQVQLTRATEAQLYETVATAHAETQGVIRERDNLIAQLASTAQRLEVCQQDLARSRAEAQLSMVQLSRIEADRDAAVAAASLQSRMELKAQEERRGVLETELTLVKEQSAMETTSQEGAIAVLASQAQQSESETKALVTEMEDRIAMEKMLGLRLANADAQRESAMRRAEGLEREVERLHAQLEETRVGLAQGQANKQAAAAEKELERLEQRALESGQAAFTIEERNLELEAQLAIQ